MNEIQLFAIILAPCAAAYLIIKGMVAAGKEKSKILLPKEAPTKNNCEYVIAPKGCESYFTAGKKYKIVERAFGKAAFRIKSDSGMLNTCRWSDCAHLRGGNWIPA